MVLPAGHRRNRGSCRKHAGDTGRLLTNAFPNGQRTVLQWLGTNNDVRLASIHHLDPQLSTLSTFNHQYDADGQLTAWTQQAGTVSTNVYSLGYDRAGQLLDAVLRQAGPAGALVKRFAYAYDAAGNRTGEQTDAHPAAETANALNQLTARAGGGPVRFAGGLSETGAVSVAGSAAVMSGGTNFSGGAVVGIGTNLVSVSATDENGNSATNQYLLVVTNTVATRTLAYDLNGNLTNAATATGTNTYEWDAANRLVKITQLSTPSQRVSEFTYDGQSRLVKIIERTNGVAVGTNTYLWCGLERCEERDATGGTVTKRFFGQGEQIGGTNFYFTRDHLGSVREVTDDTGALRARYDYDPFGRRTKLSGDVEADFGFTGHYVHAASGLHLAPYRAYDADTARWLNRDPIAEDGGINLYAYVGNDPINAVDPEGKSAVLVWTLGGLALVGVLGLVYLHAKTGEKLSNVPADPRDFRQLENRLKEGCKRLKQNLRNNPETVAEVWAGTQQLGQRGIFGGEISSAAERLSPGEQNLINYFENAREFNQKLRAGWHRPNLARDVETEVLNSEAEQDRLKFAIEYLEREASRRQRAKP